MNGIRESFLSLDLFSLTFKNIFSGFLTRGIGIRESFLSLDLFSLTFENIFSGFLTTEGSELERVFRRWIYFNLRSKIFFSVFFYEGGVGIRESFLSLDLFSLTFKNIFLVFLRGGRN